MDKDQGNVVIKAGFSEKYKPSPQWSADATAMVAG